jgi:hypothetical protein
MEIKYLGEKIVLLKGKNESVLVNPSDDFLSKNKSNSRVFLFINEDKGRSGLEGDKILINSAGEYEIGGVEINGFDGRDGNTVYKVSVDGFKVTIIGRLLQELNEKIIDRIEETDVLIVLSEESNLDYKVFKSLAKKWGANYLIPVSDNKKILDAFLDEADAEGLEPSVSLKLEKQEDLPEGLEVKLLKVDN